MNNSTPFRPEPRIFNADQVAALLGKDRTWFEAHLSDLSAQGFPDEDELLGGWDAKAIGLWLDYRNGGGSILTRRQAAKRLHISISSFDDWRQKGLLPPPIGGRTNKWWWPSIEAQLGGATGIADSGPGTKPMSEHDIKMFKEYGIKPGDDFETRAALAKARREKNKS